MYSKEQRRKAIETFARFDHSYADTVAELGYPTTSALRGWWKEYQLHGDEFLEKSCRKPKYPDEKKQAAVDYYLEHGKSLTRTIRAMGYPSREMLGTWIDELAPGQRKYRGPNPKKGVLPMEMKVQAVAELEARTGSAAEVAERYGVSRVAPYAWRRETLGHNEGNPEEKGVPVSKPYDDLPDDIRELERMQSDLKAQVRKLQLEIDVRQATLEALKKEPGTDPNRLTNAEKAAIVSSLRPKWRLKDLLALMQMAKSSYEYAAAALVRPGSAERAELRAAVIKAFDDSGGTYGYRRIVAQTGAGEWTVRTIMDKEGLVARTAKRRRRHGSYQGEISEAPDNLLRDERGKHHFKSEKPNELWVTDVTEFRIPAGKSYLSPIIDCFDGMPISWTISTSPNAEMANSSLMGACAQLREGEHPKGHSDRGCHYRWPEWIKICDDHGIVRSMSRKGCSPDNARAEGFFGRLKIEFFYGRDWSGVTLDGFADVLDAYLRWYRDVRLKSDLGYRSPMQYRRDLGLIA
ncbi:IS3 family transposase [Olsenella sp. Marseille-P4559]|uniref:IS3 family transposase n=1 Tax=Olsenella sp. Marseille-P4559 TaxID=2364795 RepID=UPI001030E6D1|nr:IS3 family transposase [Olsenella sp. Marseille-P4559]